MNFATTGNTLFFGDSNTLGQGLGRPENERWTASVAAARCCVEINEGKGGRPSSAHDEFCGALETWKSDAAITRLVLALGGNDAWALTENAGETVAANVGKMIDLARQTAPVWEIIVCGPCNVNRDHLQRQEIAELRSKNLREINAALRKLADAKSCRFVDFYGVLPLASLTTDGVHPDAEGHKAMAAAFLTAVPASSLAEA